MKSVSVLLTFVAACFSQIVSADRPSMSERSEPVFEPAPAVQPAPVQRQAVQQTSGDVLTVQPTELQPGETVPVQVVDFPRRGMSMDKVQNELGRPIDISPTVGQPPITSWSYDDRKVFFEGDRVIHVVSTK